MKGIILDGIRGTGLYAITKFIDKAQLIKLAEPLKKNGYGQYLLKLAK